MDVWRDLLQCLDENPAAFMARLVTGDDTWLHFHEPETKVQSRQWEYRGRPPPKKILDSALGRKEGGDSVLELEGNNSHRLAGTRGCTIQKQPGKWAKRVLLQYDNAPPPQVKKQPWPQPHRDFHVCHTHCTFPTWAPVTISCSVP